MLWIPFVFFPAIRRGLLNLLPEQTDKLFIARLMKVVKEVNRRGFADSCEQRMRF
jgi:hypothetical protein